MLKAEVQEGLEALTTFVDHRLVPRLAEAKLRHREMSSHLKKGAIVSSVQQTVYYCERSPHAATFELVLTTSKYPEKKHVHRVVVGLKAVNAQSTELYLLDGVGEARSKGFITQDQVMLSDKAQKLLLFGIAILIVLSIPVFFWAYTFGAVVAIVGFPFMYLWARAKTRARLNRIADVFARDFELTQRTLS